jgi:transcriptional regulator with XRE-family HTH domain
LKLRELRLAAGLSQKQLAEAAGVAQNAVSQWETGIREPSWSNVRALAAALGVTCQAFAEANERVSKPVGEPPAKGPRGGAKGTGKKG